MAGERDTLNLLLRLKELAGDDWLCSSPCCCPGDCSGCRLGATIAAINEEIYRIAPERRPVPPPPPLPPLPPVIVEPTPTGNTLEEWGKNSLELWEKFKK